jgi:hypothetical protein
MRLRKRIKMRIPPCQIVIHPTGRTSWRYACVACGYVGLAHVAFWPARSLAQPGNGPEAEKNEDHWGAGRTAILCVMVEGRSTLEGTWETVGVDRCSGAFVTADMHRSIAARCCGFLQIEPAIGPHLRRREQDRQFFVVFPSPESGLQARSSFSCDDLPERYALRRKRAVARRVDIADALV